MAFTQYEEAQFKSIMLGGDGKLSEIEAEALRKAREHEDYERGVADCIKGVKHEDQGAAYNAGYGQEYSYQMAAQGRLCHE